jgi:hypothetical protein
MIRLGGARHNQALPSTIAIDGKTLATIKVSIWGEAMKRSCTIHLAGLLGLLGVMLAGECLAGMPAVLPSGWTKDGPSPSGYGAGSSTMGPYLQGISFFIAGLLLSAWAVKGLWRVLRKDLAWLPEVSYLRALSLVILWGLLFVVVLTMISGARELMTPGAWKKQGWTYKLADSPVVTANVRTNLEERREALQKLRLALLQYAAAHEGRFPPDDKEEIDPELWNIPGCPGLRFFYMAGQKGGSTGQLMVYEPELDSGERQVLLTSGMIGTMRTAEIRQALAQGVQP